MIVLTQEVLSATMEVLSIFTEDVLSAAVDVLSILIAEVLVARICWSSGAKSCTGLLAGIM